LEYAVKNKGKVKKKDIADLEKIFDRVLSEIQKEEKKKIKHLVKNTKEIKKPLEKEPPIKQSAIPEEEEHFSVVVSDSSKTEEDEFEEPVNQYVSFRIGVEHYAVSINYVYDMKEMLPCSRIPKQPPHYLGVANLRGNIVPVIDFRSFLGVKDPQFNEYTVFLMLKIGEKVKGCVVDAINDVVVLEPENTHVTPSVSRKTNLEYVTFIAKDPKTGQFLIVLDVEKILKDD
jgi:purine-binding chemotaxis protein CheW